MHVLSIIKRRREITRFAPTPLPREYVAALLEAGYHSVSGNNLPSREFILVEDKDDLAALATATPFMPWLETAPLGIVIAGNPGESKYWLQDATIATSNIWLVAVELGLGAAWGAIHHSEDAAECERRERVVREVLGIPAALRPVSILGIGYPAVQPGPKEHYPLERVLHKGRFGQRVGDLGEI